jgi:long-subunit acyl-CoA synthetase (AMP-forming)
MSAFSTLRTSRPRHTAVKWLAISLALLASACAGVPVQEMSDTRQTIRAAETAGAERAAPEPLAAAREGLRRAEDLLKQRDYRSARREAEGAHAKAVQALRQAEATQSGRPPQP